MISDSGRRFGSRVRATFDLIAALGMIAVTGIVLAGALIRPTVDERVVGPPAPPEEALPEQPVALGVQVIRGGPSAKVGTFPILKQRLIDAGRLVMSYRHLPLPNHPLATPAAIAAPCAGEQGRFWEMNAALFRNPKSLTDEGLAETARSLALMPDMWKACRRSEAAAAAVATDLEESKRLGFRWTPAFLVGVVVADQKIKVTRRLHGALPFTAFEAAVIEAERIAAPK